MKIRGMICSNHLIRFLQIMKSSTIVSSLAIRSANNKVMDWTKFARILQEILHYDSRLRV